MHIEQVGLSSRHAHVELGYLMLRYAYGVYFMLIGSLMEYATLRDVGYIKLYRTCRVRFQVYYRHRPVTVEKDSVPVISCQNVAALVYSKID